MALPDNNAPLTLADGTQIDPATRRPVRATMQYVEVDSNTKLQAQSTRIKRKLADLPVAPDHMNALSLVVMYTMYGLDDDDICYLLGCSTEQLGKLRMQEAYQTVYNHVVDGVVADDADNVRAVLAKASHRAAHRVVELANQEDDLNVSLHASKDILDRAGHSSKDAMAARTPMEAGLRIEIIDNTDREDGPPRINITVGDGG